MSGSSKVDIKTSLQCLSCGYSKLPRSGYGTSLRSIRATLTSDWIHTAQHLSFFVTAVFFWSALYGVGRSAMSYGAATFYVFGTAAHCSALGALLTFSTVLWYPVYQQTTQSWRLSPLQDQQLGGVIMWFPQGWSSL